MPVHDPPDAPPTASVNPPLASATPPAIKSSSAQSSSPISDTVPVKVLRDVSPSLWTKGRGFFPKPDPSPPFTALWEDMISCIGEQSPPPELISEKGDLSPSTSNPADTPTASGNNGPKTPDRPSVLGSQQQVMKDVRWENTTLPEAEHHGHSTACARRSQPHRFSSSSLIHVTDGTMRPLVPSPTRSTWGAAPPSRTMRTPSLPSLRDPAADWPEACQPHFGSPSAAVGYLPPPVLRAVPPSSGRGWRTQCVKCGQEPIQSAIISSCQHLLCLSCYKVLSVQFTGLIMCPCGARAESVCCRDIHNVPVYEPGYTAGTASSARLPEFDPYTQFPTMSSAAPYVLDAPTMDANEKGMLTGLYEPPTGQMHRLKFSEPPCEKSMLALVRVENIPWQTTVEDMQRWLPTELLPSPHVVAQPIHIPIDVSNGKTSNAGFVECASVMAAHQLIASKTNSRLVASGNERPVSLMLASYGDLLKELFSTFSPDLDVATRRPGTDAGTTVRFTRDKLDQLLSLSHFPPTQLKNRAKPIDFFTSALCLLPDMLPPDQVLLLSFYIQQMITVTVRHQLLRDATVQVPLTRLLQAAQQASAIEAAVRPVVNKAWAVLKHTLSPYAFPPPVPPRNRRISRRAHNTAPVAANDMGSINNASANANASANVDVNGNVNAETSANTSTRRPHPHVSSAWSPVPLVAARSAPEDPWALRAPSVHAGGYCTPSATCPTVLPHDIVCHSSQSVSPSRFED